jgi:hypothetical protein
MENSIAKRNIKHKPSGEHPPPWGKDPINYHLKLTTNLVLVPNIDRTGNHSFGYSSQKFLVSVPILELVPKIQFDFLLMETKTDTDGSNVTEPADPHNNTGSNLNGCWRKCAKLEQGVTNTLSRPINKMLYKSTYYCVHTLNTKKKPSVPI